MSIYSTYFPQPLKVGNATSLSDNLSAGIGDVVLSQNLQLTNAITAAVPGPTVPFVIVPAGTDLLGIDLTYVNGVIPTGGVISIILSNADGTGANPTAQSVTLSTAAGVFNSQVVFNIVLAGIYITTNAMRLTFATTTTIVGTATPQVIAEVRYSIRG